jgi:hypothetical protein
MWLSRNGRFMYIHTLQNRFLVSYDDRNIHLIYLKCQCQILALIDKSSLSGTLEKK